MIRFSSPLLMMAGGWRNPWLVYGIETDGVRDLAAIPRWGCCGGHVKIAAMENGYLFLKAGEIAVVDDDVVSGP
jgi:hypothetical protein